MISYRMEATSLSTQGESTSTSLFPELRGEAWQRLSNIDYALPRGRVPEGLCLPNTEICTNCPTLKFLQLLSFTGTLGSPLLISYSPAEPSPLERITFVSLPHPRRLAPLFRTPRSCDLNMTFCHCSSRPGPRVLQSC